MESIFRYRSFSVTAEDIDVIKQLIADHPDDSRWALSRNLCRKWGWVQPNGFLRDMVCRSFLLELERAGHIKLPPKKCSPENFLVKRKEIAKIQIDQSVIDIKLSQVKIDIRQVRRTINEKLCNSLIEQYHYLGYCQPVGEHLKYVAFIKDRPIACFTWSSAARHIGSRDRYIGWTQDIRKINLRFIAYNSRFLILPWVHIPHVASHLLGCIARRIATDWQNLYQHPVYYLETFIDKEYFQGICYQAANWICLGATTGRGKNDQTNRPNRSIKAVYGYPLIKNFREKLCQNPR